MENLSECIANYNTLKLAFGFASDSLTPPQVRSLATALCEARFARGLLGLCPMKVFECHLYFAPRVPF